MHKNTAVLNNLLKLPKEILDAEVELLEIQDAQEEDVQKVKYKELSLKTEIQDALDEEGKKLYSNELSREKEFRNRCANDDELGVLKKCLGERSKMLSVKRVELEFKKRLFRSAESLSRMEGR